MKKKHDSLLFYTHAPRFYKIGQVDDGHMISRIEPAGLTALVNGGAAPCFAIYGYKQRQQESVIRAVICWFLHSRHRHRTGERWIGRTSIMYYGVCDKCGNWYEETVIFGL